MALLPAVAVVAGVWTGQWLLPSSAHDVIALGGLTVLSALAWVVRQPQATRLGIAAGFWTAGLLLGSDAEQRAMRTSLRDLLEREVGGFEIGHVSVPRPHAPIGFRAVITEDASARDGFVLLRVAASEVLIGQTWKDVDGGVTVSVGGREALSRVREWRAGRLIEVPATFRRPTRYLVDGVADAERVAALNGTTLLASVKSGILVEVVGHGSVLSELGGVVRAHVRRAVRRWVAPRDETSAAIVTAVLIGDRASLPDAITDRLQAAGTYHVIAISGGNIALMAALCMLLTTVAGARHRTSACLVLLVVVSYAAVVEGSPSVRRAALMAVVHVAGRLGDHRVSPWQAALVAAGGLAVVRPLEVMAAGTWLTFGATAALLGLAEWGRAGDADADVLGVRHRLLDALAPWVAALGRWCRATVWASVAVEAVLLPVAATAFSRVGAAGIVLNLVALPAMAGVQMAGLVIVAAPWAWPAAWAGWLAHGAATVLVDSARLVYVVPWLTTRVPPPHPALVSIYYTALAVWWMTRSRWVRAGAGAVLATAVLSILWAPARAAPVARSLRWTIFDVGQGDAMLLEFPDGHRMAVDTGGAPFGDRGPDIGGRVLAPALWARGLRSLDAVLLTHGHPDHAGGATGLLEALRIDTLWEGIDVSGHTQLGQIRDVAVRAGGRRLALRAGDTWTWGGATVRVLHPPVPDWERMEVRNDDSVVLEVVYADVALLLTGDVSAEVEREILPHLGWAPVRVLKVAHHGSRTSTSSALLDAWRPQIAIVSAGRGNAFGHPSPAVVERLTTRGIRLFRTDEVGQITIDVDGHRVALRTWMDDHASFLGPRAVPRGEPLR